MPRDFDDVVRLTSDMQMKQTPLIAKMREILIRHDGDWVLPVPSVETEPSMPPLTPALVGEIVEKTAQRASSVLPVTSFPALDPRKERGRRSKEYAATRRRIIAAVGHESKWMLGRRRAYRQLAAYHTCSIAIVPDFAKNVPTWQVRDPLSTFTEPQAWEELRPPRYGAFITRWSGESVRQMWPLACEERGGPVSQWQTAELWDVAEWHDEDQVLYGLVGPVNAVGEHIADRSSSAPYMQLSPSYPNRAGYMTIIQPHMVSLGPIASRLSMLLGNIDYQAKLMSLDILAQERAIFPDVWAIGEGNPEIVGGEWKDGRTGKVNLLRGVTQVGVLRTSPDPRTGQMVDRLERNVRISTGLIPQSGGENWGSLRTGRAMDSMAAIALDPGIQELHDIWQTWMPHMHEATLGMLKGMPGWRRRKYVLFSGWPSDEGLVEFTPTEHIEDCHNTVVYAIPGADVTQVTQVLGSLVGAGMMSLETAQNTHPFIGDGELERKRSAMEQLERVYRETIMQQIATKELPLMAGKWLDDALRDNKTIYEAMEIVDNKLRELQATAAPPAPEGMIAAPETMPGLEGGQMAGVQQPEIPPQIQPPPPSVSNMRQLMDQMV